jgi:hypothetical protein
MNAVCHAEFPSSHLCHAAEYFRSTPTLSPPAAGAWVNASGVSNVSGALPVYVTYSGFAGAGMYFGNTNGCAGWTTPTVDALVATPAGFVSVPCSETHQLACCGP